MYDRTYRLYSYCGFGRVSSKRSEKQVCTAGRSDHADRSGDLPRISRHHPSSESSMNRCYMLWYTTLCRALRGTCWVGWFVRTRRVRHGYASEPFLCIPLASSSVPEASLLPSGLRLYRTLIRCYRGCQSPPEEGSCAGAGSRWCFHLLGTFPQDPYVAYVSGRVRC